MNINLQASSFTGTTENDNLTLSQNYADYTRVDLGQGYDTVKFADGENRIIVNNVEHIIGGYGWNNYASIYQLPKEVLFTNLDGVLLGTLLNGNKITFEYNLDEPIFPNGLFCAVSNYENLAYVSGAGTIQGNDGIDTFYLFGEANDTSFRQVENIFGGTGNDTIYISEKLSLTTKIDLGEGYDILRLTQFTNTPELTNKNIGKVSGVEEINGSSATYDDIYLDGKINNVKLSNIDKLTGGTGHDTVTFTTSYNNALNLGNGVDKVILNGVGNTINLSYTESLIGSAGKDVIVSKTQLLNTNFDLKDGTDTLVLGNFAKNTTYVSGAEIITGGTGYDQINFYGNNISTVSSIEYINGGIGSDNISLKDQLTNKLTINLGNGVDTLSLSNFDVNVGKVSGAEFINGGSGKDYITLTGTANSVTIKDIEFLTGGNGDDKVTSASSLTGIIDLGAGNDKLSLAEGGNSINVSNIEQVAGNTGSESIAYKTALIDGIIDLKGGTDTIKFGDFINSATIFNTEKIILGNGNDSITLGNNLTIETIFTSSSGSNDIIFNFDQTKDKIDLSDHSNITINTTNKTISDGSGVFASYDDSSANLVIHFTSSQNDLTLMGIDSITATNFII